MVEWYQETLSRLGSRWLQPILGRKMSIAPFGRYWFLEQLHSSGLGLVYRVHDLRLHRPVTLRVVPISELRKHFGEKTAQELFEYTRYVGELRHPWLAPLAETAIVKGMSCLVIRMPEAGTLRETLKKGPVGPTKALNIADRIATALGRIHAQGLVHCNVSPSTVLLDKSGRASLTSVAFEPAPSSTHLGTSLTFAKALRAMQHHEPGLMTSEDAVAVGVPASVRLGSPSYAAPEQLAFEPVSARSDIYSLGAVLYEAMVGGPPYQAAEPAALLREMETSPPPSSALNAIAGERVARVVLGALRRDPEERPPTVQAFAAEMREAMTPTAPRVTLSFPPAPESRASAEKRRATEATTLARFVNVCLTREEGGQPVPRTNSLAVGSEYLLRIDIGPLSSETLVENALAEPFPSDLLPPTEDGYWLEVVVTSDDFEVASPWNTLFLPRTGASWVCDCSAGRRHQCGDAARRSHLYVTIRCPREPGAGQLRIGIYYDRNLVQSQLLTVQVAAVEKPGDMAQGSWIDYTLSARLGALDFLPPRDVNILTNRNTDGTHRIVVNGGPKQVMHFRLTEGQMTNAMEGARRDLYAAHVDERGHELHNRFDDHNAKPQTAFLADLKQLAPDGWALLQALTGGDVGRLQTLRSWLREPATVQVSRAGGSEFVFPWALVYDIPITRRGRHRMCELVEQWDGREPLVPDGVSRCPHEAKHDGEVLCPFGFWGYRHVIEQPPSMPEGKDLPRRIAVGVPPPGLVIGRSVKLDPRLSDAHLGAIRGRLREFDIKPCDSVEQIVKALAGPDLELLYLYCHGRRRDSAPGSAAVPALVIGTDDEITPPDLTAWHAGGRWPDGHWVTTGPLVFINGCHTVGLTPGDLVNFVDAFTGIYASGVVGTEITMHQQVANEAAEEFLFCFKNNESVGTALRTMRLHLLRKGNLLGLAYTAYCSAELCLEEG